MKKKGGGRHQDSVTHIVLTLHIVHISSDFTLTKKYRLKSHEYTYLLLPFVSFTKKEPRSLTMIKNEL